MRDALQELLFARWPELYRLRSASPTRMNRFEHGDGWWSILDALSETVCALASERGEAVPPAFWSKEKFGTLRWSLARMPADAALCEGIDGAVACAESASARTCEHTGEPGCLWCLGSWYSTCSPGHVERWIADNPGKQASCILQREDGTSLSSSMLYEGVPACPSEWSELARGAFGGDVRIEVPPGLADVAASLLEVLASRGWRQEPSPILHSLRWNAASRAFEAEPLPGAVLGWKEKGVISMASALARRTDMASGVSAMPLVEFPESAGQASRA